jgi:hypothetical protein
MIYRTYDSWKAHNPADEELGSAPQSCQDDDGSNTWPSDEELGRWEHFGRYDEKISEDLQNPPEDE